MVTMGTMYTMEKVPTQRLHCLYKNYIVPIVPIVTIVE